MLPTDIDGAHAMAQAPDISEEADGPGTCGSVLFEASLQHVASTLAAGATAGEQLQSGAGPLTLEVPLRAVTTLDATPGA